MRWLVVPMCVLVVSSSFAYPWQLMLRFRLSHAAFETALKEYKAGKFTGGAWVGLYRVKWVSDRHYLTDRPPSVGFRTGSSFIDPVGFEYDPLPGHPMKYLTVQVARPTGTPTRTRQLPVSLMP
jgi:hypothetical protein